MIMNGVDMHFVIWYFHSNVTVRYKTASLGSFTIISLPAVTAC